jgi:hypothetical protein
MGARTAQDSREPRLHWLRGPVAQLVTETNERRRIVPGRGLRIMPVSISPWQFAHTRTHFFIFSLYAVMDLPLATLREKDFAAGST